MGARPQPLSLNQHHSSASLKFGARGKDEELGSLQTFLFVLGFWFGLANSKDRDLCGASLGCFDHHLHQHLSPPRPPSEPAVVTGLARRKDLVRPGASGADNDSALDTKALSAQRILAQLALRVWIGEMHSAFSLARNNESYAAYRSASGRCKQCSLYPSRNQKAAEPLICPPLHPQTLNLKTSNLNSKHPPTAQTRISGLATPGTSST